MIIIKNLSGGYGSKQVIKDISISIESGSCYLLLGKNGSGKTTLINLLANLIAPSSGIITFKGSRHDDMQIKRRVGFYTSREVLIEEFTGLEYMKFLSLVYKIPPAYAEKRINELFDLFFEERHILYYKRIEEYSSGMRQKLRIIGSVLHEPEILILDEPFSHLDILSVKQVASFFKKYKRGKAILLASHVLGPIEDLVTHIGIIENGRIIQEATIEDFTAGKKNSLESIVLEKFGFKP
ncbi:MAG: ABC transporter ATP-binding protein [Candidatus Calescibacterium sp.]|nr:ABC transporter ATP-binding protein [Candidatus Calescibacterium sp.]